MRVQVAMYCTAVSNVHLIPGQNCLECILDHNPLIFLDKFSLQYGPTRGSWSKTVNETLVAKQKKKVKIVIYSSVQCALDPMKK